MFIKLPKLVGEIEESVKSRAIAKYFVVMKWHLATLDKKNGVSAWVTSPLTLKQLGTSIWDTLVIFWKMFLLKRGLNPVFFNIVISYIFPKNLLKIPDVVQEIWRIYYLLSLNFFDSLSFPRYKETNDVNLQQIMSAFQYTLNGLFNQCQKLYWYYMTLFWNIKRRAGRSDWHSLPPPPGKTALKKRNLIRVKKASKNLPVHNIFTKIS